MAKSEVQCRQCERLFLKENKYLKTRSIHYCSRKCMAEGMRRGETRECEHCNKKFYATRSDISRSRAGFCSRSCAGRYKNQRRGTNSPLYTTGSASYRQMALDYYPNCCRICGYDTLNVLQVHHIDGNRLNNGLDNLIILCPTHHKEADLGLRNADSLKFINKFLKV